MTDFAKDMLEFNSRLLESYTSKKDFRDYFQSAYSECIGEKVTPAFLDDFIEMSLKTGIFVVDQEMLFKYKVITSRRSNDVLKCLNKFKFKEDKDYRVSEVRKPVKQGGFSVEKVYTLSQTAFKLCLIRAENSWEYAMYFINIEKIIKFYYKYMEAYNAKLLAHKNKLLAAKDNKIDTLTSKTKELRKKLDFIIGQKEDLKEIIKDQNEEHNT